MKKILVSIIIILITGVAMVSPMIFDNAEVFAADGKCVLTSVLGNAKCNSRNEEFAKDPNGNYLIPSGETAYNCSCDDGEGSSIKNILNLVARIMYIGVGVLTVLGVSIVGVQYLTAGGNEEQVRKAKRRMIEVVIGAAVSVLIYALLEFLVPDFEPWG